MLTQVTYLSKKEAALEALTRMYQALERYAEKPNANQKYLDQSRQNLADIATFISTAEQVFGAMMDENSAALARGIEIGKSMTTPKPQHMREIAQLEGKEAARSESISRAMNKWPELY